MLKGRLHPLHPPHTGQQTLILQPQGDPLDLDIDRLRLLELPLVKGIERKIKADGRDSLFVT
jgi:hypothetical protein